MPRTLSQKIIFSVMMAAVMVYGMEVYNILRLSWSVTPAVFVIPLDETVRLILIVMGLQSFVGGPLAKALAVRVVDARKARHRTVTLAVSTATVLIMCPLMSLVATAMFKGLDGNLASKWLDTFRFNLPMAFTWQIFVAGPLVRTVYSKFFSGEAATCSVCGNGLSLDGGM
jgi:hypothetical protein